MTNVDGLRLWNPEKSTHRTQQLLGLVVLQPMSRAGNRFTARGLEVLCQSRGLGVSQEALLGVQQQYRASDARPERYVIVGREPVRRPRALVGVELPGIRAIIVPSRAKSREMQRELARKPLVV